MKHTKDIQETVDLLHFYGQDIAANKLITLANELHEQSEETAGKLYETYCTEVGGKAFNGDILPGWKEFRADKSKKKQSDAWVQVAITALFKK